MSTRYIEPQSCRFIQERIDGVEQIRLPMRRNWFVLVFLSFWICGWTVGGIAAMVMVATNPQAFIIFWLGGSSTAAVVRANLMVFFLLMGCITGIAYAAQGLLMSDVLALSILLGVPFMLAMWTGARWFHGASELAYRRAAYLIITLAAIVSMPLWDGLLR